MDDGLQLPLRFLHYAVLLGLFGLTAFRVIGLRRIDLRPGADLISAVVVVGAILAPFVSSALMLVSIAAMMGQSAWMLDWETVEAIIVTTSVGLAFIARLAFLSLGLVAVILRRRLQHSWLIAAMFYGAALITLAWSGHAAATEGVWGLLHRLNDGLHLLAAGLWIGAIGWFLHLTIEAHRNPDHFAPEPSLKAMRRFAPLGVSLVAIVAITGVVNAHLIFELKNTSAVSGTDYGLLLTAKIMLVGLMLVCGANNATINRRSTRASTSSPATKAFTLKALRASLFAEFGLGIAIVGIVALLGMASPTASM